MEPIKELTAELAALHRGQGVRAGDVHRLVGPALISALQLDEPISPVRARDQLIAGLVAAVRTLPPRQAAVFEFASGLKSSAPTMAARLDQAAAGQDRDTRTLRRWLDKANVGVAIYLLRNHDHAEAEALGHPRRDDWFIESMWMSADLNGPKPVLRAKKTLFPAVGGAVELSEPISLPPHPQGRSADIVVTVEGDAQLAEFRRESDTIWFLGLRLHKPMQVGELITYTVDVTLPGREFMAPMIVFTPIRPTREFRCTVDFGHPPAASQAWVLRSALPHFFGVEPMSSNAEEVDLTSGDVVDVRFTNPPPGLTCGLQWTWA